MINNGNITEKFKLDAEVFSITSDAGSSSKNYSMQDYSKGAIMISAQGTFDTITLDLMGATALTGTGATNSSVAGGIVIGSSVNTAISTGRGVKTFTLTMASVATGATGDAFTLCGKTFVFSTTGTASISTLNTTTKLYWGSSLGSTENGGIKGSIESLKAAIEATGGFGGMLSVTTVSTANAIISLTDTATMNEITFGSTGSTLFVTGVVNAAAAAFEFDASELAGQGYSHVGAKVSTTSSLAKVSMTLIRSGVYKPVQFKGVLSKNT